MGRVSGGPGPDSVHVAAAVWGVPTPAVGLWGDVLASDRGEKERTSWVQLSTCLEGMHLAHPVNLMM